ncbi:hypothetical protein QAD02_016572 [Eretmocerus hayati]|uniref:Uncharacterized protein n=1 Tax=Eretmocerus hayati TaxID=131215 RepID=A0ACC2PB03_9HYME|nr:hypothetical protein QAD02_016572 [Eretmocerus hayati]
MDYLLIVNHLLSFMLMLYADPGLPRKLVTTIISFFDRFLRETYIASLRRDVFKILEGEKISATCRKKLETCFQDYSSICNYINTESKCFTILRQRGLIDPEKFKIGTTLTEKLSGNKTIFVPESLYGVWIPLRKSLKMFLEIPGIFDKVVDYVSKLNREKRIISNIMQADLWIRKYSKKFVDEIVFPLYIFIDDLEVGNALGSHAGVNKFLAIYAMIACLPPEIASRLMSILFVGLLYTSDKKDCSNADMFRKIITELNFLSREGIMIQVRGVMKRIKFQYVLLCGDNLGLNGLLGFHECFTSGHYCRICKAAMDEASKMCAEDVGLLRTKNNYNSDVESNTPSETGIRENCVFHDVDDYHLTENTSLDMMHDFLEGVCVFVMSNMIHFFVFKEDPYFDLHTLNARVKEFNYGSSDSMNKPPPITAERLLKRNLKMSASEMLNFVRYFGIIMGDRIPTEDKHYQSYLYVRRILDILMSPRIVRADARILQDLLTELNRLFIDLYGKLKPKLHFLIHYARLILELGPVVNFWAMRFESNHRPIKAVAESTHSTTNLLKTIATKMSLEMCQMMHSLRFDPTTIYGSIDSNAHHDCHFGHELSNDPCKYYVEVSVNNVQYKIGTHLVLSLENSEVEFGKIIEVVSAPDGIYFNFEVFEELYFNFHYHAYVVSRTGKFKLMELSRVPKIAPVLLVEKDGDLYISPRHGL